MSTWLELILGGVGVAMVGVLGTIVVELFSRRKRLAEAKSVNGDYTQKVGGAYSQLVDQLQERLTEVTRRNEAIEIARMQDHEATVALRARVMELELRVREQETEISRLRERICVYEAKFVELGVDL